MREKCPIRRYFWPVFPVFSPNTGKYVPDITQYLDTFHVVLGSYALLENDVKLKKPSSSQTQTTFTKYVIHVIR